MKTTISILGCAIVSMLLITSCSKSDDNDMSPVQVSPLTKVGIVSPLKYYEKGFETNKYVSENFVYHNNFLESVSGCTYAKNEQKGEISLKVGYNPLNFNLITDETEFIFSDIKTNDSGSVTQFTAKSTNDDAVIKYQFEYDNENELTREKMSYYFSGAYSTSEDVVVKNFTWKDGDIVSQTINSEHNKIYDSISRSYNYNSKELNSGLYLIESLNVENFQFDVLLYTGLFGKATKHIPYIDSDEGTSNTSYIINPSGQITKACYAVDSGDGYEIFGY